MATIRLVPSTYSVSSTYLTVSNASNMYTNTDSTNYATVANTQSGTSSYYIYIKGFNFSSIPSNATVSSFTVKLKAYQSGGSTSTSYVPYLCNNTTTLSGCTSSVITTSTQTLSFSTSNYTFDQIKTYGDNFGIRINCRRNSRNTQSNFYIYGAEILVEYTVPVYYNVTVTGDSNNVSPTGTESILQGSNYTVTMYYDSTPTVTDNNVNVTSQLVEQTGGSSSLKPESNTNSGFTLTDIENAYADSSSTNYARLALAGRASGTIYLNFESLSIPSSATVQSISCQLTYEYNRNNSSSGYTASCQLYADNTAKGSSTSLVTAGGTAVSKTTINLTPGTWSASDLSNARLYITATNSASSTQRYIYVYGATLSVTYTFSGKVYTYTLSNITAAHTIVVTAPAAAHDTLYLKVNGTWKEVSAVYKKVNGSWVEQTDLSSLFESGINYIIN